MSWQCPKCNHHTANGQKHNCINDERDALLEQNKKLINERDELLLNESKMNGALSAKQEIINGLKEDFEELKAKLKLLRRYHFGDGSITREQVMDALKELGE